MADEQTPGSFDDAVDPSSSEPQAPTADVNKVRASRPVRKRPGQQPTAGPTAEDNTKAQEPEQAPADAGATAAPRPQVARPVRRNRPVGAQADATESDAAEATRGEQAKAVATPAARPVRRESRRGELAESKKVTPALFVRQSADELRKVIWPTASQLRTYFTVVLLFVLFIVAYVGVLDGVFGWLLLKFFGHN